MTRIVLYLSIILGASYTYGIGLSIEKVNQCPSYKDNTSYETKNLDGHSTYSHFVVSDNIGNLIKHYNISLKTPTLDVGAGYGTVTYELLNLGFKNIYTNDLSANNLKCANGYLDSKFPKLAKNIKFIPGDINKKSLIGQFTNNYFGLVVVRNVLQFFDANQLDTFLTNMSKKMSKGGYIYIVIENGSTVKLLSDIDDVMNEYEKQLSIISKTTINRDQLIDERNYQYAKILYKNKCPSSDYLKFRKSKRFLFYPCNIKEYKTDTGDTVQKQLYSPVLLKLILNKYDFRTVSSHISEEGRTSFTLIAQKK
jgi:SAM-dependent methyltransferase